MLCFSNAARHPIEPAHVGPGRPRARQCYVCMYLCMYVCIGPQSISRSQATKTCLFCLHAKVHTFKTDEISPIDIRRNFSGCMLILPSILPHSYSEPL
jgi:hypothetical protein